MNHMPKLLGVSASLRNARGNKDDLVQSLKGLSTREDLDAFLEDESSKLLKKYQKARGLDNKCFAEVYGSLAARKDNRGLSNSEVGTVSALWAAQHGYGVDIEHLSLKGYSSAAGRSLHSAELRERILAADGILVSTPVYFGDRSSLAQIFLDFLGKDEEIRQHLKNRPYVGVAVGAKRNGGQETTLIYHLMDYLRLGMLGIGNDTQTTAQYGGTGHAGDVGTMCKDRYGLDTSMGAGRHVASLMRKLALGAKLKGSLKVLFVILQDSKGTAAGLVDRLAQTFAGDIEPTVLDVCGKKIHKCLACDFCPTHIDRDEVYRCAVTADDFPAMHPVLLGADAIVPVVFSGADKKATVTNYQCFLERTRYLRRGDYALADRLLAPLVCEELGHGENYSIRLITSFIRHNTVISTPLVAYFQDGACLNEGDLREAFARFVTSGKTVTAAAYAGFSGKEIVSYNPVGYVLSANKDREDRRMQRREDAVKARIDRLSAEGKARVQSADTPDDDV